LKRLSLQSYEWFLLALIVIATIARLLLIAQNWPVTNSDEANMALLARHVAYNGEWPIFFYGLPYMGPIEGYIAAPLFHLFGPSTFALRLGLLPFFFLFAVCMYFLTRLLYTRGLAIFTVVLLCFGSSEIISREIKAVGEYPEIVFFAAAICLLLVWLARSLPMDEQVARPGLRRVLIYGLLGLIVGAALWVDFLILPFIGCGALFLFLFCRRELWSWASISLLLGMIIGAFPLILYNVTAPLDQNSIAVLLSIHSAGSAQHPAFIQQLAGTFLISLPDATGLYPLCADTSFPLFGNTPSIPCTLVQGGWSVGYLVLWTLATLFAARFVWRHWRRTSLLKPDWTFEDRQKVIVACGRLLLLISAAGTIVLFLLSSISAVSPGPTARYLVCLLVALPATLWPLWKGLSQALLTAGWRTRAAATVRAGLLALTLAIYVIGAFGAFVDVPRAQAFYNQQEALVQKLLSLGATRVYSEYWTCNRLTFQSQEKIICSALDEQLNPGFNRYIAYWHIVEAAPHPVYLFPIGMPQIAAFDRGMRNGTIVSTYRRLTYQNYVIYLPGTS
jgi:4-amino-4-deoxy-L-arabinose transferase-like glycosyltransferase